MIRAIFACFLASLLLITWADDIYLGDQTPDDPSDDCGYSDNDIFISGEAQQNLLIKTVTDLPILLGSFDSTEARTQFLLDEHLLTSFRPRLGLPLFYVFMSLVR